MGNGSTMALIGTTAAHALWIGALVAAWAEVSVRLMRQATPAVRYGIARAALMTMAAAPILVTIAAATAAAEPWQRWAGLAWVTGAGALGIRLANSLRLVLHLVRTSSAAPESWQSALTAAAGQLGLRDTVALRSSALLEQPCTVGVWRPIVLMPADLLSRVTPAAFHAIAAHELAHVVRRDYLWNLLLVGCETVLFFHPAVPWLSRMAHRERELACDAVAGGICKPLALAEALAAVEHRRVAPSTRVATALEQPLRERVRALIAPESAVRVTPITVAVSVALGGSVLLSVLWAAGLGGAPSPSSWMPLWSAAGLGLMVGLRHAFEADHLVAVATLVARERNAGSAARLGASWGAGHTVTLLVVGTLLIAARQTVPASLVVLFEGAVAVMVIAMGVRAIREGLRLGAHGPVQWHDHGHRAHAHAMSAAHIHIGSVAIARRPMLVGVIHGLAGSGALTALAVASLPAWPAQVGFMLVFGVGSTAGMALVAAVAGWPLARLTRTPAAMAALSVATGLGAVVFGLAWVYPLFAR